MPVQEGIRIGPDQPSSSRHWIGGSARDTILHAKRRGPGSAVAYEAKGYRERAMMDDLDGALRRLAEGPAHPGLATIDAAVFERARAARGPGARASYALAAIAVLSAGGLGLASA